MFYIAACDYLGERMASLFGITSAKYQYAIDEYNRIKKEVTPERFEEMLSSFVVSAVLTALLPASSRKRRRLRRTDCRKKRSGPSTS